MTTNESVALVQLVILLATIGCLVMLVRLHFKQQREMAARETRLYAEQVTDIRKVPRYQIEEAVRRMIYDAADERGSIRVPRPDGSEPPIRAELLCELIIERAKDHERREALRHREAIRSPTMLDVDRGTLQAGQTTP